MTKENDQMKIMIIKELQSSIEDFNHNLREVQSSVTEMKTMIDEKMSQPIYEKLFWLQQVRHKSDIINFTIDKALDKSRNVTLSRSFLNFLDASIEDVYKEKDKERFEEIIEEEPMQDEPEEEDSIDDEVYDEDDDD